MKVKTILLTVLTIIVSTAFGQELELQTTTSDYNGYGVSCFQCENGFINLTVNGGIAPYTFIWSNGQTVQNISSLKAGVYNVTVKDAIYQEGYAEIILTEPPSGTHMVLELNPSNYHGYNVGCFGGENGTISCTVIGGTPPYFYKWSHRDSLQTVTNLKAQYYRVIVSDVNNERVEGEITLTQPMAISAKAQLFEYPNGYNLSMNGACNGIASLDVSGGVSPMQFLWSDGITVKNRSTLCFNNYDVTITDHNGCELKLDNIILREPPKVNWSMDGNANTNPVDMFIGTTDSVDFVLKTKGKEVVRLTSDGKMKVKSLNNSTGNYLTSDSHGYIQLSECTAWNTCGNVIGPILNGEEFFGSINNSDVIFKANNNEVMRMGRNGKVGIGTSTNDIPNGYTLSVNGGILCEEVKVIADVPPDYVFENEYSLMDLKELENYLATNKHLPEVPSASESLKNGYNIVQMQELLLKKIEELTLYIIQIKNENEQLKEKMNALEKKQ